MFMHIFLEIAVYRPVTQRFYPLSRESHRWETGRHPGLIQRRSKRLSSYLHYWQFCCWLYVLFCCGLVSFLVFYRLILLHAMLKWCSASVNGFYALLKWDDLMLSLKYVHFTVLHWHINCEAMLRYSVIVQVLCLLTPFCSVFCHPA